MLSGAKALICRQSRLKAEDPERNGQIQQKLGEKEGQGKEAGDRGILN